MTFKKHVFATFTGKDNQTLDLGRILWALGVLVFFAMSIYSVWHGTPFNAIDWGTGFAAVLTAGGATLWLKRETEPKPEEK